MRNFPAEIGRSADLCSAFVLQVKTGSALAWTHQQRKAIAVMCRAKNGGDSLM
jgi:hypothetical protein